MSIPFTWVYLIYDPYTRLFKIGRSDNPAARLKQLQNQSSYGTVAAAPCADYQLLEAWLCAEVVEKMLHDELAGVRVRGEWFDIYESMWTDPARGNPDEVLEMFQCHPELKTQSRYFREHSYSAERAIRDSRTVYQLVNQKLETANRQLEQMSSGVVLALPEVQ